MRFADLKTENVEAVRRGLPNLARHLDTAANFGVTPVVALNHFGADTEAEVALVKEFCRERGLSMAVCRGWELGGAGAADLARAVVEVADQSEAGFTPLYDWTDSVEDKILQVCQKAYGASDVVYGKKAQTDLKRIARLGLSDLPICMAKTPASLSDDPSLLGRPEGFEITVREIQVAAGAGFLVPITGDIMRMPGLPKVPGAVGMHIGDDGEIVGLS